MKLMNMRHKKGSVFFLVVCALVASVSITALATLNSSPGAELPFDANTGRFYGTKGTVYVETTIGAYAGNTMRTINGLNVSAGYLGTMAVLCDINGNIVLSSPMSTNPVPTNSISTQTNYRTVRGTYNAQGCGDFWNVGAGYYSSGISPRTPNLIY